MENNITPEMAKALAAFAAEVPVVPFDKVNPHFKSGYASLGAIIKTVTPILSKHGLAVMQPVVAKIEQGTAMLGIESILLHVSGGILTMEAYVPMAISGNVMQAIGSQITYLRRYGLSSILNIYTDEDDDGNGSPDETEVNRPARQTQPRRKAPDNEEAPQGKPALTRPFAPEFLTERIAAAAARLNAIPREDEVILMDLLADYSSSAGVTPTQVLKYLTMGNAASPKLKAAIYAWLNPTTDDQLPLVAAEFAAVAEIIKTQAKEK